MRIRNYRCVWATGLFLATSIVAMAQAPPAAQTTPPPDPPAAPTWSIGEIDFTGLIDGYYSFNNNHPASGFNTLRNFEVKSNQFSLNMVKLSMSHAAEPVGFTLDLGFGRAWDIFHATDPAGKDLIRYIPQAYVTLKPENWGGFQIDFGKFYTSAGAELTENNLTWSYGRGYLYTNGPYYHFGTRISKPVGKGFTLGFQLVNGWNNVEDNNSGKTVGFTTAWAGSKVSWYNTYYVGPEKTGTNDGIRHFYDTVLNLTPSDKATFYINYDYGREKQAFDNSDAIWTAIGLAGRFQTTEHTALAFRYENYRDHTGFITLAAQTLNSFTLTGEYKWAKGLLSRLEYRRDWSDVAYFERGNGGFHKNQDTITLGVVAFFGPK